MQYLFQHPMPIPWLLGDLLALGVTLFVVVWLVRRSRHPAVVLLEAFAFVFLYAGIFENFAVVQGWYVYGRSFLMIGDVPLAVPLIEADVLLTGLALLEKMNIPTWCKPFVVGLFGMLQDFSLDPVATRQVFTSLGQTSGRWTWLLEPGMANIHAIPVYNFPGWMLIMLYASIFLLIGRWWFRRSGFRPAVGYLYPFLMILLALVAMVSPLSRFLLWLGPFFSKGSPAEWIMLAFHLLFPLALLAGFWRGRMRQPVRLKEDAAVFVVVVLLHLADILAAVTSGMGDVLWLVILSSLVQFLLLAGIVLAGRKMPSAAPQEGYLFEP